MWRWLCDLSGRLVALGRPSRVDIEAVAARWEGLSSKLNAERERVAESLSLALDAAQMGQWDLDLVHNTTIRSPRHDEILGYVSPTPQWGWDDFLNHVAPEDRDDVTEQFRDATRKGGALNIECRIVWPDNTVRWIAVRGRAYLNEQGKPVRVAGVIMDITERKQADDALRKGRDELERRVQERTAELEHSNWELLRSNQELDDFAYIASHDLKEPLRGIHNYSSFLIEDYGSVLDEEGQSKLNTLRRLTQRMEALIDSLLNYSRVGRVGLAFEPTDINKLVADVLGSLHVSIEAEKIDVRIPRPLPTIQCDRVRVREIYHNLISNAIKYNDKPNKWIEIGYRESGCPQGESSAKHTSSQVGPSTVFYVKDNGVGIREKHSESIFRIFKRLHARDQFGGGTGVGLTIVKKIIERHGGTISVRSTSGVGTSFEFTLPEAYARQAQENARDVGQTT